MEYKDIRKGRFLERPNRFIARVELRDEEESTVQGGRNLRIETVHVKNTGRCRELLQKGAAVYLEKCGRPGRSTAYDLVAVEKGNRMITMDSQAPNRAVEEWLLKGGLFPNVTLVRPEMKYGNSRFDFYIEAGDEKIFMEVKGVTLEEEGVVRFPDAPSDRAVKHVEELVAAKREGYRAIVMFVIQMTDVRYFTPNRETHPEFADVLCLAAEAGVEILAYDCLVEPGSMLVNRPVPVVLDREEERTEEIEKAKTEEVKTGEERAEEAKIEEAKKEEAKTEPGTEEAKKKEPGKEEPGEINETFRKKTEKTKLGDIPIPLLKWYDKNRRALPWREFPTPYRVWVSEIMLQQTRVEAVKPYFERFMNKLPDIGALADAEEETLLKLWEGLGYYNRVRNMQKAAVQIRGEYGGKMPESYEELLKLAGIGSYTAGAIASIAFGRPVPAVDGNVLRVAARLREDARPVSDAKVRRSVEEDLKKIMPAGRPGDFNQAMMEIGACVCIPNGMPLCGKCPLEALCMAHAAGTEQEYPVKQAKKPRKIENRTVLIIRDGNRTVIRKRQERGLLAGMYEFPSLEGFRTAEEVVEYLAGSGLKAIRIQPLEEAKHIFTHREWHMRGYMVRVDELEPRQTGEAAKDWLYIEPEETKTRYPIPSAFGAYTKYLSILLGKERHEEEEEL